MHHRSADTADTADTASRPGRAGCPGGASGAALLGDAVGAAALLVFLAAALHLAALA